MSGDDTDPVSVLLVEDEFHLADLYERYLEEAFSVRTATNGRGALKLMDDSVDVVLLDRQLPSMSGDEVLETLRERGYEVPVAMVTAVAPDEGIVDMPFDEYLTKPVDRESLVRTVRVLANRASFEEQSRAFFRLASKKASLDSATGVANDELADRMAELRATLDETVAGVLDGNGDVTSRLTPDSNETRTLLAAVGDHTLPEDVAALVTEYQRLRDARPPFMWKWVHRLAPQNTLPCVDARFRERVPVDKTITILFITLLDDVLEKHQDRATFDEIAKIPLEGQTVRGTLRDVDADYVDFAQRVWETLLDRLRRAPNYELYEELLHYDVKQAINSIEYSDIAIRRPDLATMGDLERYESHNMVMFAYADIDLMHTSSDVRDDLPTLREVVWCAQLMARIGNWVSTWERELREGDYCSGPVVHALDTGLISRSELNRANDDAELTDALVDRIKRQGVEAEFLTRWERRYHQLRQYDRELSSIDLEPFIDGTEEVLRYHLATTGLK